jgi:hypothetical protein
MNYKEVTSFKTLKEYLMEVRPQTNRGDKVICYRVITRPWPNGPRPYETFIETEALGPAGTYREFYGYLEDVFHNVNHGLLEITQPQELIKQDARGGPTHLTNEGLSGTLPSTQKE